MQISLWKWPKWWCAGAEIARLALAWAAGMRSLSSCSVVTFKHSGAVVGVGFVAGRVVDQSRGGPVVWWTSRVPDRSCRRPVALYEDACDGVCVCRSSQEDKRKMISFRGPEYDFWGHSWLRTSDICHFANSVLGCEARDIGGVLGPRYPLLS